MINIDMIRERLIEQLSPTFLEVIDESDNHIDHVEHRKGGRHFAIRIASASFDNCTKVEAHRMVYALFADLMPHPLHALRIEIVAK